MALRFDCTEQAGRRRGLDRAHIAVGQNDLVCFPVDSAYALGCDAFSPQAVESLRRLKGTSAAPPVMVGHVRTLDGIATGLSRAARDLVAAFWPGPLTLLCPAQPTLNWDLGAGPTVAVRMPLHPIALELLDRTGPMAVTGGNPPGESEQPGDLSTVREAYGDGVQVYLDGGVITEGPWSAGPSTVVDVTGEVPRLLRVGSLSAEALIEVVADLQTPDGGE